MSSTTGSTTPSADAVRRAAVRHARQARARSATLERPRCARSRSDAGVEVRRGAARTTDARPRRRARRRRHDAARAAPVPRHAASPCSASTSAASASSPSIPAERARGRASRARSPATSRSSSCRRSTSRSTASAQVARQRRRRARARSLGRMVELDWEVGGEDLGTPAVRRRHLLDALGVDRVQPLERRPGARLGPRRDGRHVRRAALAARAPARRRRAGSDVVDPQPDGRRPASPCSSTATRSAELAHRRGASRVGSAQQRSLLAHAARVDVLHAATARPLLRRLRIENLVLIREAELELAPGLNAITGETGAGKTILAQAIGLLLGARGDAARVGPAAAEAYVEAELDLPDGCSTRRLRGARRAAAGGRGRRSCSRGGSSPTGARARTRGAGARRARTWPRRPSGWSRCRASSSSAGSRGRRTSSTCSTRSPATTQAAARPARAAWRELGAARRRHDELMRDAAPPRRGSPSCARSPRTPRDSSRARRTSCAPSASGCGT